MIPTAGAIFSAGATQSDQFFGTWTSRPECDTRVRLVTALQQSCTTTEAWRLSSMPLVDAVPSAFHPSRWYVFSELNAAASVIAVLGSGASIGLWLRAAREAGPWSIDQSDEVTIPSCRASRESLAS